MMQEADEEDVELVAGGRRSLPTLGLNSDSSVLKKTLIGFGSLVVFVNFVVFIAGLRLAKDYIPVVPPPSVDPLDPLPPWTSFRLPKTTLPLSYQLFIDPDMNSFTYTVQENIHIEISEKRTNVIYLHSSGLNVSDVSLYLENADPEHAHHTGVGWVQATKIEYNKTNEFVMLEFGSQLTSWLSQNYTRFNISLTARGEIGDIARGFYRSSYTEDGQTQYLAVTDFEPTDARSAFVCFDEPSFKANFKIRVSAQTSKGYQALSNMPMTGTPSSYEGKEGYQIFDFENSPKMSTYLVCFVVSKFEFVEPDVQGKIPVRVFGPPDQVKKGGKFPAETAKKIVEAFGEYFGIDYALPKLDLIALPDFTSGAMENWGLITFRIESLLWDPSVSSLSSKQNIAMIVSHEIAHQWFGNLVTMAWWDNVWLNEGFASFVEYLGVDLVFPEWNIWGQFLPLDRSVAMELDALASSHPLVVPIERAGEITQQFDSISYSKGASVIRMLQDRMNSVAPNSFRDGIRHYLKQRAWGNAKTEDLWASLVEATGQTEVPSFMKSWTEQVGFPFISLTKSWSSSLTATQRRFLSNSNGTSTASQTWAVPLTVQNSQSEVTQQVFSEESTVFEVPEGVLIGNVNGSGFYRVLYDTNLLSLVLEQLEKDHTVFSDQTRASLLNDAFAFNLAQKVPASYPLSMTAYMKKEDSYVGWVTVLSSMSTLRPFVDDKNETFNIFQRYIRTQLNETLNRLGWKNVEGEEHSVALLRPSVFSAALTAESKSAIDSGYQKFVALKNNGTTDASKDLNGVVYASAAYTNGEAERREDYNWLVNRYREENQATEKSVLLNALTRFRDRELIEETLRLAINSSVVKDKDTTTVLINVARSSKLGRELAWNFFKDNFALFQERYGQTAFTMDRLVRVLTGLFSDEERRREVEEFFIKNPISQSRTVSQSLESININIKWRKMNEGPIKEWFDRWSSKNPLE